MSTKRDRDIYRETPFRYVGLSHEIMKRTVPVIWRLFPVGLILRNSYIAMDILDKAYPKLEDNGIKPGMIAAFDAFLWQILSSVLIPCVSLRCIGTFFWITTVVPPLPQVLTLATIPFVVSIGDNLTENIMDSTYREKFGSLMDINNADNDPFRRAPLRYMGLSYEFLATAFPLFTWRALPIGQTLRSVYISMDALDKSYWKFKREGVTAGLTAGGDALLWQALASITIPGISLRFLRSTLSTFLKSPPVSKFLTLAAIPVIVPFGDEITENLMNMSYREVFGISY